jgi:hypothetical protein
MTESEGLSWPGFRTVARMIGRALILRCPNCGGRPVLKDWFHLRLLHRWDAAQHHTVFHHLRRRVLGSAGADVSARAVEFASVRTCGGDDRSSDCVVSDVADRVAGGGSRGTAAVGKGAGGMRRPHSLFSTHFLHALLPPLNTAEDILSGESDYGAIRDCGSYSAAP